MALCQDQHGLLEGWDQGCCCRVPFHAGVKQVAYSRVAQHETRPKPPRRATAAAAVASASAGLAVMLVTTLLRLADGCGVLKGLWQLRVLDRQAP
jgi:hypothetical protein